MTARVAQLLRKPVVSPTGWVCRHDDDVVEGMMASLLLLHPQKLHVPVIVTYVERNAWGRVVAVEAQRQDNGRVVEARDTMPHHEQSAALLARNPAAEKTRRRAQFAVATSLLMEDEPVFSVTAFNDDIGRPVISASDTGASVASVRVRHDDPGEVGSAFGVLCARAVLRARRRMSMRVVDGAVILQTLPTDDFDAAAVLRPILQAMLRGGGVWFDGDPRTNALRVLRDAQRRARNIIGDDEEQPEQSSPSRWTPPADGLDDGDEGGRGHA